jgi:ADP-ribose pyrophosphatase YjhB (NUDIX family)
MTDPPCTGNRATVGAGAVVVRDARLLLVRITYGWAQGRWLIPSGEQHPGESLAECAVRELQEEAGLRGRAGAIAAVRSLATPSGSDTFIAFHANADPGDPQPDGRETDAARFLSLDEIEQLHTDNTIVRLHRLIAHHILAPGSQPAHQTLPARDRNGNPGTATVYLL